MPDLNARHERVACVKPATCSRLRPAGGQHACCPPLHMGAATGPVQLDAVVEAEARWLISAGWRRCVGRRQVGNCEVDRGTFVPCREYKYCQLDLPQDVCTHSMPSALIGLLDLKILHGAVLRTVAGAGSGDGSIGRRLQLLFSNSFDSCPPPVTLHHACPTFCVQSEHPRKFFPLDPGLLPGMLLIDSSPSSCTFSVVCSFSSCTFSVVCSPRLDSGAM
jgi:hypothetical protein